MRVMDATTTAPGGINPQITALTPFLSAVAVASNTESAGSITIPDSAMALALTRELKKTCDKNLASIGYPPYFGPGSPTDLSEAKIQAAIQAVDDIRREVHGVVDKHYQDLLTGTPNRVDVVMSAAISDVDTLYDNFVNALLQPNSSTGTIGSAAILQGMQLTDFLSRGFVQTPVLECVTGDQKGKVQCTLDDASTPPEPGSDQCRCTLSDNGSRGNEPLIVLASVVAAGGTQHTKKNILTALITGDDITYSGGAAVNFSLWSPGDSKPQDQNVYRYRTDFKDMRKPTDQNHVDCGDNLLSECSKDDKNGRCCRMKSGEAQE